MTPDNQQFEQPTPSNAPQPTPPAPDLKVDNPLAVMQPGERVICEIRRHPIGIIGTYITAAFLIVIVGILAFVVAPMFLTDYSKSKVLSIGALVFIFTTLISLAVVAVSRKVYRGNRWIVTSDSLTQVVQTSLFDKKSSQLSLANLEDVTAEQNGILAHMYNYGVLRAETAGEHSKFVMTYCPNPNYYAQQILEAREKFEQFRGERGEYESRGVNVNMQDSTPPGV